MWLYKVLDGLFPSSFVAKLNFVAFCGVAIPPVMVAGYLFLMDGTKGLLSPVLYVVLVSVGLAFVLMVTALQALTEPLRDLRRTLGSMHSKRLYRPLPTCHVDDVGVAMQATNRIAETMGARLDPAVVDGAVDPLTGALRPEALDAALIEVESGSMLAISLDEHITIQENHGPEALDRLLAISGRILRDTTRKGDIVGLQQDGQFCVFLRGAGREVARHVADRIRVRVARETSEMEPGVTISVGLAVRTVEEETGAVWTRAWDAMMAAQIEGQDRVVLAG